MDPGVASTIIGSIIAAFSTIIGYLFKQNQDLAKEYGDYRKAIDLKEEAERKAERAELERLRQEKLQ